MKKGLRVIGVFNLLRSQNQMVLNGSGIALGYVTSFDLVFEKSEYDCDFLNVYFDCNSHGRHTKQMLRLI